MASKELRESKVEKAAYVPPSGWSSEEEDEVDPVLREEYNRQLSESDCFDLDISIPSLDYQPYDLTNENLHDRVGIYGRIGLHWYNLQKGSNLQLVRLVKYVTSSRVFSSEYFITMEVMDPAHDSLLTFQTCVVQYYHCKKGDFQIVTQVCRIKPIPESSEVDGWSWSEELVNDFHDGKLEWLPDYALAQYGENQNQYYEVQESDILENDWLNLYTDFAYSTKRGKKDLPLKIKKVVVQTHEDVEPSKKLSSGNAIFYITFNEVGDTEDYKAVVSRITDGKLGHVALEVRVVNMEHLPAKELLVIPKEAVEALAKLFQSHHLMN